MLIRTSTGMLVNDYEFRHSLPHVSFPPQLTPAIVQRFGGAVVQETQPPAYNQDTQYASVEGVEQVDGEWRQKWVIKNFTPEELEARKPPTMMQKLASAGISIQELKAALGL